MRERKRRGEDNVQLYVPDETLLRLGAEWEQYLFNELTSRGLNIIQKGHGVAGSDFQGGGRSPPDFKLEGKVPLYIEITGTQKLIDYRNLLIGGGKHEYVQKYSRSLILVFYQGRVNQIGNGARIRWIRGQDCEGYRLVHVKGDIDKGRSQGMLIPKEKFTEGIDSLVAHLKSLGEVELMLLTDSDEPRILEWLKHSGVGASD